MDMSSRDVDATITYDAGNTNVELEANMDAQSIKVTQQVRRSGERSEAKRSEAKRSEAKRSEAKRSEAKRAEDEAREERSDDYCVEYTLF